MPTVGSLFSGIGGLDLGLERAGWDIRWQVENDPYCQRVLAKHWPHVKRYGDIREVSGHELEPVDLICGGFPCQPVSLAGKRQGQADSRWLWPEFARLLRMVRPRVVLVENVPGLLIRGGVDVLNDLTALGYDTEWETLPAAAFGAPHIRYRIFIVAYAQCPRGDRVYERQPSRYLEANAGRIGADGTTWATTEDHGRRVQGQGSKGGDVAHAKCQRLEEWRMQRCDMGAQQPPIERNGEEMASTERQRWDGRSRIFGQRGRQQFTHSAWWATEPDVDRVDHGIPHRVDRLRGLGNAIVPQVAEWIGKRLGGMRY
jgi:DNA (cytosine-5)-methyltransferase 1